jgi:predicted permease
MSQLLRLDVGFPTERIVTASPDLEGLGFTTNNAPAAVDELRRRFSMLPGVEAVGMIDWLPLTGERGHLVTDHLEGYAAPDGGRIEFGTRVVGPGCLRALGIPVLEGREVSESDLAAQRAVALVNESFVRKFWPNQAVLGKHLQWRGKSYCEVIGIARDARFNTLAKPPEPTVFYSAGPWECLGPRFVIRVSHDPAALLKPVMAELARLHPALRAQGHVFTMRELMRQPLVAQRETLALLGRLGALALGLTVLGVYGVMSWLVAQRTREIGIRMAVGARRGDVARLILGFGAWVAVAGIGAGLAAAAGGGFLLRQAVFGVRPFDLPSFAMAAGAVLPALLLACAIPVFRATRVDPMNALRCE